MPGLLADPTVDEQVKTIRSRYDAVEKDLSSCKQVKRDLLDDSGGRWGANGLFLGPVVTQDGGEILRRDWPGAREEYYFWDGRLFFILRVESRYDKPLSGKVASK